MSGRAWSQAEKGGGAKRPQQHTGRQTLSALSHFLFRSLKEELQEGTASTWMEAQPTDLGLGAPNLCDLIKGAMCLSWGWTLVIIY